jgi:hypothetical protein
VTALFNLRQRSLARGNTVVLGSVLAAAVLVHFPHVQPTLWLLVPMLLVLAGTLDTVRNVRRRWSFYHAGVMLCLYMDLMSLFLVLFFLIYPFLDMRAQSF